MNLFGTKAISPPSVDAIIAGFEKIKTQLDDAYHAHQEKETQLEAEVETIALRVSTHKKEAARALRIRDKINSLVE